MVFVNFLSFSKPPPPVVREKSFLIRQKGVKVKKYNLLSVYPDFWKEAKVDKADAAWALAAVGNNYKCDEIIFQFRTILFVLPQCSVSLRSKKTGFEARGQSVTVRYKSKSTSTAR